MFLSLRIGCQEKGTRDKKSKRAVVFFKKPPFLKKLQVAVPCDDNATRKQKGYHVFCHRSIVAFGLL